MHNKLKNPLRDDFFFMDVGNALCFENVKVRDLGALYHEN